MQLTTATNMVYSGFSIPGVYAVSPPVACIRQHPRSSAPSSGSTSETETTQTDSPPPKPESDEFVDALMARALLMYQPLSTTAVFPMDLMAFGKPQTFATTPKAITGHCSVCGDPFVEGGLTTCLACIVSVVAVTCLSANACVSLEGFSALKSVLHKCTLRCISECACFHVAYFVCRKSKHANLLLTSSSSFSIVQ